MRAYTSGPIADVMLCRDAAKCVRKLFLLEYRQSMAEQAFLVFVLLILLVGVIFYVKYRPKKDTPADEDPQPWRPLEPSSSLTDPGSPHLSTAERPLPRPYNSKDARINAWRRAWQLPVLDNGAFTFRVHRQQKQGGVVVGLQNSAVDADNWATSGAGYAIVLDNGDIDRPKSWVGKLPYYDKEMPGSRQNFGSLVMDGDQFWVAVQYGLIVVGRGSTIGQNVILVAHDPTPVIGIRYFGFGLFGKQLGEPILVDKDAMISDIAVSTEPLERFDLPNCVANCDGLKQLANIHQMTKPRLAAGGLFTSE